jgi:hypothetical protein
MVINRTIKSNNNGREKKINLVCGPKDSTYDINHAWIDLASTAAALCSEAEDASMAR